MDLLKKITEDLEPLGGELAIDRFVRAQRAEKPPAAPAGPAARAAAAPKAPPQPPPSSRAPRVPTTPAPELEPEPAADANGVTDTGKLRAEVQEFLNRDEAEGTDDSEVQEFLKERQGFNPSELE